MLTTTENVLGNEFWEWLQANNQAYLFINEVDLAERTRLLDEMMERLHRYCDQLYFKVGGHPKELIQELIITAEGKEEYFERAEGLVEVAPRVKNWKLIGLMPAMPPHFEVNFEGVLLDTSDLWFEPLENKRNPDMLGIRIFSKDYSGIEDKRWLKAALFKMLDILLGEKSFAIDIDYVDMAKLPDDPEEEELMKLDELPKFVEWKKRTKYPPKTETSL